MIQSCGNGRALAWVGSVVALGLLLLLLKVPRDQARADGKVPATTRASAEMARPEDLKITVVVDRDNFRTTENPRRVAVVASLVNRGERPVLVYVPGFVGPILGPESDREAVPLELRSSVTARELVLLEPGELIGRTFAMNELSGPPKVSAYYTIYSAGHEGASDHIRTIVHSDGAVSAVRPAK